MSEIERDMLLVPQICKPLHGIAIEVCNKHGLTPVEFFGNRRHGKLVKARQEACWRAYGETEASLPEIGRAFKRHHSTVIHAIVRFANLNGLPSPFKSKKWA